MLLDTSKSLNSDFKMKDMSMIHYFSGQEVSHMTDEIFPESRKTYNGNIEEVQCDRM
jgi:hypothetical protein